MNVYLCSVKYLNMINMVRCVCSQTDLWHARIQKVLSSNSTSVAFTQYNLVHNVGVYIIVQVSDRSPNTSIKLCTSKSMRDFYLS